MLLHFIFVIEEKDRGLREKEFKYIEKMAQFYKRWISDSFGYDYDVRCDQMVTSAGRLFGRLDTHNLVRDHRERGSDTYHFYLCHFRPFWTDCTCEGYHAENFGMILWKKTDSIGGLAKNCSTVSHELAHELLRKRGHKRYTQDVHDLWTRHLFDGLSFDQYDDSLEKCESDPSFLAIKISEIKF